MTFPQENYKLAIIFEETSNNSHEATIPKKKHLVMRCFKHKLLGAGRGIRTPEG